MNHLQECPMSDTGIKKWMNVPQPYCICDRLRACEQRKDNEWASFVKLDEERNIAYAAGVQAARDAVAPLMDVKAPRHYYGGIHDALAAIDALKENP